MVSITDINKLVESIDYKTQLIGRNQRLQTAVKVTRLRGIIIGFLLTFIIIGIPILYYMG